MNKFLANITIGIVTLIFITILLYLQIQYPNTFNILGNYLSVIASLATILAACFAAVTLQNFKKQKRAELLSQLSLNSRDNIQKLKIEINKFDFFYKRLHRNIKDTEITNQEDFSKEIEEFQEKYENSFPNAFLYFDLYFHVNTDIYKLINQEEKNKFNNYQEQLSIYYKNLNTISSSYKIEEQTKRDAIKNRIVQLENHSSLIKELGELQKILTKYYLYN